MYSIDIRDQINQATAVPLPDADWRNDLRSVSAIPGPPAVLLAVPEVAEIFRGETIGGRQGVEAHAAICMAL